MLKEFGGNVFIGRVFRSKLQRHQQHDGTEEAHPRRAIRLLQRLPVRQRLRSVENAYVIQAQEAAGENLLARHVLAVHPPRKADQQFVKEARQKHSVPLPMRRTDLVNAPRRPCLHRRIYIAQGKLIGRRLPAGVHVPLAMKQNQLLLGKFGVDLREQNHVEAQVPGRIPRVLPLIWHGDDVAIEQVRPIAIAPVPALSRGRGLRRVTL